MRNVKLFLLLPLVIMGSCAYHVGTITTLSGNGQDKHVEFRDVAMGYSKTSYFFGIGGLGKDALVNEAKRNMYLSYPLQNGDNFENLTLDHKVFVFGPYVKHEAIVIADVVRRDSGSHVFYNSNYLNFLSNNVKRKQHSISLNEAVVYYHNGIYHAKVLKLNRRKISIFYVNKRGAIKVKSVRYDYIFKASDLAEIEKKCGFTIGDQVTILSSELAQSFGPGGSVQYMNEDCALIKTEKGLLTVDLIWLKKESK